MKAVSIRPRVFVVDDDPAVLRAAKTLLEDNGYAVTCHSSAEEFLAAAPTDAVGCLITDLNMPGMKGDDLQRHVAESHPCLSVIMITGVADVSIAVQVMARGAVTLLQKPYAPQALVDAVQKAIEQSQLKAHDLELQKSIRERLQTLSDEEREVMKLMVQGLPNKRIVMELQLSSRTVDRRRAAVLTKMQVNSVAELAAVLSRLDHW